jgi:L-2-hydroxyglutarate oxidase LhgO
MVERIDCVIAGAGVIGLAVARSLAMAGRRVIVLEQADAIGTINSSRNSEVIHAGLYYPPGSLKARTCVDGRHKLVAYAESRNIDYKLLGKLIVAQNDEEMQQLIALRDRGNDNGVEGLELLSKRQANTLEPSVKCVGALLSTATGIIDSHGFMQALESDIEAHGGMVVCHAPVLSGRAHADRVELQIGGLEPMRIETALLVNAAGYDAPALSNAINGIDETLIPTTKYCKGNYFTMTGRAPFSRLIYPAPVAHGLGVHLTLDLGGQARFGPDTEWIDSVDYNVDPARADQFYDAIRRYWPDLPEGALQPGYAGIRPKIEVDGALYPDFMIKTPEDHGVPVAALYGIESPGLTAALALADFIGEVSRGC